MPVIVDEVAISIEVSNRETGGATTRPPETRERQTLVEECVERVLGILEQKKER
jgi:hypothetical protein